ncbi:MAG: hypothetical protein MZV49_01510 [Rhodopseudomonas palustris]|nr:hypothetical protein [Rhodopseudomonas palustris]
MMMVVAPRDFDGCARNPDAFFDRELVDDYLNRRVSGMWLRFRNFRARDVLTYAVNAEQRRSDLVYDDHGSGPLTRQVPDIGWAVEPETACFAELTGMAQFLDSKNIQFVLVTLPLMRGWSERYDPEQSLAEELRLRIAVALEPTRAISGRWHRRVAAAHGGIRRPSPSAMAPDGGFHRICVERRSEARSAASPAQADHWPVKVTHNLAVVCRSRKLRTVNSAFCGSPTVIAMRGQQV